MSYRITGLSSKALAMQYLWLMLSPSPGGSGEDGYRANVRSIIKRIRKKFLQCDETFAEIENFAGLGYRWANPTGAG